MSESEIWINQKKINGMLCQVDWRLIEALREVVAALKAPRDSVDLTNLVRLIDEAEKISDRVAIPDPPGCAPRDSHSPPDLS